MKIGFIGGHGHHYLRGLLSGADSKEYQAAVSSDGVDPAAAKNLASQIGVEAWYDQPEALLDEFKPDVVSIGAVYAHNADRIAEALARKIPVVSDKPIATTWSNLERLTELTEQTSTPIITELPFRAQPEFRAVKEAIRRDRIGRIVLVTSQKSYRLGERPEWYGDRDVYGGTMLWVASHAIDAVTYAAGNNISKVVASHGNLTKPQYGSMEDHCAAMLTYADGTVAIIHADYLRPDKAPTHGDDRLRVAGEHGVVEVRGDRCILIDNQEGEVDITDWGKTCPIHEKLLLAATQGNDPDYSTEQSLGLANLAITCRDAADSGREIVIDTD
jgi:predicted dehydrogenase